MDHSYLPVKALLGDRPVDEVLIAKAQATALTRVLHPLPAPILSAHRRVVREAVRLQPMLVCPDVRVLRETDLPLADLVVVGMDRAVVSAERFPAIDADPYRRATAAAPQKSTT